MKKYILIALGASFLMACTAVKEEPTIKTSNPDEVSFSAYLNRSTTKAGAVGELNTTGLQTAGFGVFGYHTDNALYSQAALPNFMYNTQVSTASWTYSPIKYWPNEFGGDASSEAVDRLTFFAYAPWVKVNSATGALDGTEYDNTTPEKSTTTGITRLSRATDTGDPLVSYVVSFDPAKTVDLTWGVAQSDFNKSAGTSEGKNSIAAGDPYINVARPNTGDKIAFGFEHALASLNVQIKSTLAGGAAHDAAQTKVYVRSVTFEGFSGEGSLNLNSKKGAPQWVNYFANGALTTESITVYDGLRDGREATSADANEKPANLNPNIIQSTPYGDSPKAGVTATAVNLLNSDSETAPIYVIPTGDKLKVTIAYDVETIDDKILGTYLADGVKHGSVVENTISKTIDLTMVAGKKYVVTLNLGLNSVDFDAEITDWGAGEDGTGNLPASSALAITNSTDPAVPFTSPMMLWGTGNATRAASAAGVPDGYSAGAFTYTSSDTSVATVDASGVVTAVGPGESTITASVTATKSASVEASASYKVYVNAVTGLELSASRSNVYTIGETYDMDADGIDDLAVEYPRTSNITAVITTLYDTAEYPADLLMWTSSAPATLSVVSTGEFTSTATCPFNRISGGDISVTASVKTDYCSSTISESVNIKVKNYATYGGYRVGGIFVQDSNGEISIGDENDLPFLNCAISDAGQMNDDEDEWGTPEPGQTPPAGKKRRVFSFGEARSLQTADGYRAISSLEEIYTLFPTGDPWFDARIGGTINGTSCHWLSIGFRLSTFMVEVYGSSPYFLIPIPDDAIITWPNFDTAWVNRDNDIVYNDPYGESMMECLVYNSGVTVFSDHSISYWPEYDPEYPEDTKWYKNDEIYWTGFSYPSYSGVFMTAKHGFDYIIPEIDMHPVIAVKEDE